MPNGFRGDAVYKYLDRVEKSLDIAIEVHSRDLLRGAPTARTGRPSLPQQINETVPYRADTAFSGEWARGMGHSGNIVVDEQEYLNDAYRIDKNVEEEHNEFYQMVREAERVSETSFSLPQTRYRLKFYLYSFESFFPEAIWLTNKYSAEMRNYVKEILVDGPAFFVWNRKAAGEVRAENERAMTNQESNMRQTIEGCHRTVDSLQVAWDVQDDIARNAMKRVSDGNGGSKLVPDTFRRQEARLNANEIQAQMNGINKAIIELNETIREQLHIARSEVNRFFETTEQRTLDIDHRHQNRLRDIGYEIFNLTNRNIQIKNDLGSVFAFGDSFDQRPDFLRWLSENHKIVYLDVSERLARSIFDALWNGGLVLEEFMRRPSHEFSSAEFWALAMMFTKIEDRDIARFLQLTANNVGEHGEHTLWSFDAERINGILNFLAVEELRQRAYLASMEDVNSVEYRQAERHHLMLLERSELLALVGSLNYSRKNVQEIVFGAGAEATTYTHGPIVGDINGPTLTFTQNTDGNNFFNRLTYFNLTTGSIFYDGTVGLLNHETAAQAAEGTLTSASLHKVTLDISRPMIGIDTSRKLRDVVASVLLPRYEAPNPLVATLRAGGDLIMSEAISSVPKAGPIAGVGLATISAYNDFQRDMQIHKDMNYAIDSWGEANLFNEFGVVVQTIESNSGRSLLSREPNETLVVASFSDRSERALNELNNIIADILNSTEDADRIRAERLTESGLPLDGITPEYFLNNPVKIEEALFGPPDDRNDTGVLNDVHRDRIRKISGTSI